MMEEHVPQYFINQVVDELGLRCEELYNKLNEGNIRDFLHDIISSELTPANIHEVRRNTFKELQKTKKRWLKSLQELSNISKVKNKRVEVVRELDLAKELIEMYGMDQFKKIYEVDTLEDLNTKRVAEVTTWANDKTSRLIDFLYIKDKTPLQIKKAIKSDTIVTIADILIKNFDGNINKIIIDQPLVYTDHAAVNPGWSRMKLTKKSVVIDNKLHYISEYQPDENYSLLTLVNQEIINEDQILRAIDETDSKLFRAVLSMRDRKLFFEERKIYVTIGDLVRRTHGSDNKSNYLSVKSRLTKLANVKFNVLTENETLVFGIFDRLHITEFGDGEMAEITIAEDIHQNYMMGQVVRAYSDKLIHFENRMSEHLIFPLQKERFLCYLRQSGYTAEFDYTYFIHKIQFRSKRKDINLTFIEECLNDFVNHGVTVESYVRKKDVFHITFLPVKPYEAEDLLGNQQINHFMNDPEQLTLPL
ncbi:hypothetical protein AB1I68_00885 [Paenibacillus pabuli]|uniref:hypothetical protein n=1 Tax=Paenibacillus pabuli TaxID=1472 RepID=UPI00345A56E3